jgi:transcription elongation factor Elf1
MATTNVACPYCGSETRLTIPEDETLDDFFTNHKNGNITGGCGECGKRFGARTS